MKIGDVVMYDNHYIGIMLDPDYVSYNGRPGYLCQFWLPEDECWEQAYAFSRDKHVTLVGNLESLGIRISSDFRMEPTE